MLLAHCPFIILNTVTAFDYYESETVLSLYARVYVAGYEENHNGVMDKVSETKTQSTGS